MTKISWRYKKVSQLHTIYDKFEGMDPRPRTFWRFIEFVIIEPTKQWRFNINVTEIVIVILTSICFDIHHFYTGTVELSRPQLTTRPPPWLCHGSLFSCNYIQIMLEICVLFYYQILVWGIFHKQLNTRCELVLFSLGSIRLLVLHFTSQCGLN